MTFSDAQLEKNSITSHKSFDIVRLSRCRLRNPHRVSADTNRPHLRDNGGDGTGQPARHLHHLELPHQVQTGQLPAGHLPLHGGPPGRLRRPPCPPRRHHPRGVEAHHQHVLRQQLHHHPHLGPAHDHVRLAEGRQTTGVCVGQGEVLLDLRLLDPRGSPSHLGPLRCPLLLCQLLLRGGVRASGLTLHTIPP